MEKYYSIIGRTPERIKEFLGKCKFDYRKTSQFNKFLKEPEDSPYKEFYREILFLKSVLDIIQEKTLTCKEAADLSVWALSEKFRPRIVDLNYSPKSQDHSICIYQNPETSQFGSIGFNPQERLKGRETSFETLDKITVSYDFPNLPLLSSSVDMEFKNLPPGWALHRRYMAKD